MALNIHILPEEQKKVWAKLKEADLSDFILYGGTALALHLGHRESIDFDFFGTKPVNLREIQTRIPWIKSTTTAILQNSKNTLSLTISLSETEEVKLSFFGEYKFPPIEKPFQAQNNVKIASIRDILVTKLHAVFNREEVKDYQDISEILESSKNPKSTLEQGIQDLFKRYPQLNLNIIIKTLTWFENFSDSELPQNKRDILENCCLSITKAKTNLQSALGGLDMDRTPKQ